MLANPTHSAPLQAQVQVTAKVQMGLGRLLLAVGLIAFLLMPMGHGCGLTHKHPNEDDDGVAFRLDVLALTQVTQLGP